MAAGRGGQISECRDLSKTANLTFFTFSPAPDQTTRANLLKCSYATRRIPYEATEIPTHANANDHLLWAGAARHRGHRSFSLHGRESIKSKQKKAADLKASNRR